MRQLTTEQRVMRATIQLMKDERFIALAGVFMVGKRTVTDKQITACTNGIDEVYGRAFVDGLNDAQLRFLIAHEAYHKLLQHATAYRTTHKAPGFDQRLANMAMDYVINIELDDVAGSGNNKFLEMPPDGCLDAKYRGLSWLDVYRLLKQQQQQQQQGGKGSGKGSPGDGSGGGGFDEHEFEDDDDESGSGDKQLPTPAQQQLQQVAADIDKALRQGAMMAGKGAGNISRLVGECLEAQVDWRAELMQFVTENCAGTDMSTWRRPARRSVATGGFMPSKYDETLKRLTIGVDTSGSISQQDLTVFLSEIKVATDTCNPHVCDLIYWDDGVARAEVYEGAQVKDIVSSTKPAGGGGTAVRSLYDYITRERIEPTCIVIFTDGYVPDWDNIAWPAPVLWCITIKGLTAPSGRSLHVDVRA